MSKKVNVMADVDQVIYETVVVPHKQSKTFTTLIESLIEGYYSNAYIRSFVDDKLDGIQHESNDVLNNIINSMHQGLANMGVYTEEIKSTAQDGIDAFSEKASEMKKEIDDLQSQEMREMKDSIEMLKSQNEEIMGMLRGFVSSRVCIEGVGQVSECNQAAKEEVVVESSTVVKEDSVEQAESNEEIFYDLSEEPTFDEEPVQETSEAEAFDIMAGLLDGQEYSF